MVLPQEGQTPTCRFSLLPWLSSQEGQTPTLRCWLLQWSEAIAERFPDDKEKQGRLMLAVKREVETWQCVIISPA